MKGLFVVFEGIDGSGKTSVCEYTGKLLKESGFDVVITAEPTKDPIGTLIRSSIEGITQDAEALLFAADRAQHTVQIKKWVEDGKIVICDRYYASTLAYQSASFEGESSDMEWLRAMNDRIIMEPDITFLIDVSPETGLRRANTRGKLSKFERTDYLGSVRDVYLSLAEEKGFTIMSGESPIPENASKAMEMIISKVK